MAEGIIGFETTFMKVTFPQRGAPGEDSPPQKKWRPSRRLLDQKAILAYSDEKWWSTPLKTET